MKRMALILTIIFTICMFAGCGSNNASASLGTGSSKTTSVSPAAESKNEESSKAVSRDETDPSANGEKSQAQESVSTEESILYIGMEDYFREYPVDIPRAGFQNSDEVDAYIESLIGEIANLTG